MDQDLTWWAEVVFADWRSRPGPRYARLAAALLEAVEQRTLTRGARVPAERVLAATVGASRGTVVACLDQLVQAGVLTRRQGAGTYVAGRPSWAARAAAGSVAFLMPTGHNPTGLVMPALRRQALAAVADAGRVTLVEDLTLADLVLDGGAPPPLAALSTEVIAIGSVSKVLWGGLRVGWIRAPEPLRSAVVARKSALNLGTAVISQALAARLLGAIDPGWVAMQRAALTERRDLLAALLARHLPAWRTRPPRAGLSLWAELPLDSADAFALAAARHGVTVMTGGAACVDGRHRHFIRLSFAEQPSTLELAVERLAAAWEAHAEALAASPARP